LNANFPKPDVSAAFAFTAASSICDLSASQVFVAYMSPTDFRQLSPIFCRNNGDRALDATEKTLAAVLRKARFWETRAIAAINECQRLVLNKLLNGFEGKLTSSKWAKIAKCSQDTAYRDIQDLIERGILVKDAAGGRSTSYSLRESSK
jgi:hypothetical protein